MPYKNPADRNAAQRRWYSENKERISEKKKALWRADPEKMRASVRKAARKRIGCVEPTGEQRVSACEICGAVRALHYDHDHETGTFRGWLCPSCNGGLGLFRDNPALLDAAAAYLRRK